MVTAYVSQRLCYRPTYSGAKSVEELLPWLYRRGISTGDFHDALAALFGEGASGRSASTLSRLKPHGWMNITFKHNVTSMIRGSAYLWADGLYSAWKDDRLYLLGVIKVTARGHKELLAVEDGYRESEASWYELRRDLRSFDLKVSPKLAPGDGTIGF